MEQNKNTRITIYSYQKLWRWNMKIYALSKDLPLPRALPVRLALYVGLGYALTRLLFLIPVLHNVPFILKMALAVGIAMFLDSVKLDGKNPIRFFAGCIRYFMFEQGMVIEHFCKYEIQFKKETLNWYAGSRERFYGTNKKVKRRFSRERGEQDVSVSN